MSKRFHGEAFTTTTMMSAGGKTHEQEENIGPRLIRQPRRMKRLLGTVKRQIFGPSYDPYQRDQVEENDEKTATEKNKEEEEVARDERPTKRHRSIASALMNSISTVAYELFWNTGPRPTITDEKQQRYYQQHHPHHYRQQQKKLLRGRDIDFTHFQTSSAWEHRLQQAEQFIRRVCLQSQQQQQQQRQRFNNESSTSWFGLPPFAAEAYKKAVEEDNNKWGLVNKEDYEVCFLVNNSSIPPPKPKRNIQHQQQPSIVPNY